MKKIVLVLFIIFSLLMITGCDEKNQKGNSENIEPVVIDGEVVETDDMTHEHCTRAGSLNDGEVSLSYELYYTGDTLKILQSKEQVISSNSSVLDEYEQAYKGIHSHYENLAYYDTEVTRTGTAVTSLITIDYDHVDIEELISIEGEEDNIFENKVPKVSKWKELAKKFGATCNVVGE